MSQRRDQRSCPGNTPMFFKGLWRTKTENQSVSTNWFSVLV